MPTYEYVCTACGHRLEAVQSFSDPALTTCPDCQGALRKVFGNVGIVLKGSGFYKNDSRSSRSNGAKPKEKEKESTSSSSEASSKDSSSTKDSKDSSSTKDSKDSSASSGSASGGSEKAAASAK